MTRRLLLLAAALLFSDFLLYRALRAIDTRRIFYDRSGAVSPHRLDYWVANSYDPELGWDLGAGSKNNLGASRHSDYPLLDHYKIKAFGDSFTFGSDVPDEDTWTHLIESETGWQCLNYAVPGYGPDQSLLKFRRTKVKSEVTILGIHEENIARVVNIYRAFYMDDWGPPKPRFFVDGDGLRPEPNPIRRAEDAYRLLDPAFVQSLRRLDYWARYNEEVLGAPARLAWPATWTILRHSPFFTSRVLLEARRRWRPSYEAEFRRFKPYHLYQEPSEALEIVCRLAEQFIGTCHERGERPLILVFPSQHTVDLMARYNRCVYEPLVRRLRGMKAPFIDFGAVFVKEHYARYYLVYNGHFSRNGNGRVAAEIIHWLQ